MPWFEIMFPVLILCWPVAGAYVLARWLRLPGMGSTLHWSVLWIVVSGLIVIHFVVSARIAWDTRSFMTEFYGSFALLASAGVWFGLVVPAARKARPAYEDVPIRPTGGRRTASLAVRGRKDVLPRSAWVVGWGVFAVYTVIVAMVGPRELLMVLAWPIPWLPWVYYATRRNTIRPEAEPFVDQASPELLEAYDRIRRLKSWRYYWLGLSFTVFMATWFVLIHLDQALGGGVAWGAMIPLAFFETLIAFQRGEAVALRNRLMTAHDVPRG